MDQKRSAASAYDFVLEVADLETPKIPNRVFDIRNIIMDIDIYESIDNPFLTAVVGINDDNAIYSKINFSGVEKLTLGVRLPEDQYRTIKKVFYIDKVIKNIRANDQQSYIMLHLIEDIGYLSDFINVNKTFKGKGKQIIVDIFKNYFDRDIVTDTTLIGQDAQQQMKIIAPNITPLQLADWVKDRITGQYGEPYYLYSTFPSQSIYLQPFNEMVDKNPRITQPFRYSQAFTNTNEMSINDQLFIIDTHHDNNTSDFISLNKEGFVNTKFLFHDVNHNYTFGPGNVDKTENNGFVSSDGLGKRWTAYGLFANRQLNTPAGPKSTGTMFQTLQNNYPSEATLPWRLPDLSKSEQTDIGEEELVYNRPESRIVTQSYASYVYDTCVSTEGCYAYTEGRNDRDHMLKIDSKAFRSWLTNESLTFSVAGRLFISADRKVQTTVGVKANLQFTTSIGDKLYEDAKRSGEYLLYAARHSMTRDGGYRVYFTAVKLNYSGIGTKEALN